ncbi:MAG: RidA family protein [Deltaproteobacteria bacterium]|nr:RidA family protein [Deltaproteobacteria bacterium]
MSKRKVIDPAGDGTGRYTFSPGVVKEGKLLCISGLTAADSQGNMVGQGDIVAQARAIYIKIGEILDSAGASFDDVVKTVDYITTTENYRHTADVRREFFKDNFPAATGVIVAGLLRPDALIEIDALAVID